MASRRNKSGWVYFIQETMTQAIKIGTSIYPRSRIGSLQVGNAYELVYLGDIKGGNDVEAAIHFRFRKLRLKGEWFAKSIATDVKEILANDGDLFPPLFLADWPGDTITLEKASWMVGVSQAKMKSWLKELGMSHLKASGRGVYQRSVMQSLFARLYFTDDEDPSLRKKLLGIERQDAQAVLF